MASDRSPRVLLDANVIFSGFQRRTGTSAQVVDLAGTTFQVLVTSEVVDEVVRNLARKVPRSLVAVEDWFDQIEVQVWDAPPEDVEIWKSQFGEDAHVVAAALAVEVDFVCTGDNRLREGLNAMRNAPAAVTPGQLLDLLSSR